VANAVLLSIPVVGNWLSFLIFGGEFPAEAMIPRLFVVHILIVPGLILALISAHMIILIRQKHSQFPGPGRRDTNVVGSRLWPGYAVRSVGLMFAVFATSLLLGGLVQINPIWLWGPFEPGSATAPAQPDWYVGWVDGALRLWPAWEPDIVGYRLPALFLPAVVMPGVTFLVLYLWPWLERLVTKDRRGHQVLERPRDRPGRVAVGVGALTFYGLLLVSFSLDVVARYTGIPVFTLVYTFRVLVLVLPFVTGWIAFGLARGLRDSGAVHLMQMGWSGVRTGFRRRRRRPDVAPGQISPEQTEPAPHAAPPRRPEQGLRAEELDHLPIETGPVP
jgi:ubiquinol-cytochrome c reductase cytochrome b subunit